MNKQIMLFATIYLFSQIQAQDEHLLLVDSLINNELYDIITRHPNSLNDINGSTIIYRNQYDSIMTSPLYDKITVSIKGESSTINGNSWKFRNDSILIINNHPTALKEINLIELQKKYELSSFLSNPLILGFILGGSSAILEGIDYLIDKNDFESKQIAYFAISGVGLGVLVTFAKDKTIIKYKLF